MPKRARAVNEIETGVLFCVSLEGFGNLCCFFVALMEKEAMAHFETLTGLQFIITAWLGFVIIMQGERVGGEKAIGADMPASGVAEARGMIEHGDAELFAFHG